MASETSSELINWQYLWEYDDATNTYILQKYKSNPNLIEGFYTAEQVDNKIQDATVIDAHTYNNSERPVQNKVLKAYIDKKIANLEIGQEIIDGNYLFNFDVITRNEDDEILNSARYSLSVPVAKTIVNIKFGKDDSTGVIQYYLQATQSDGQTFILPLQLDDFVRQGRTINGKMLSEDIVLKVTDLENDAKYLTSANIAAGTNISILKDEDNNIITISADTYTKEVIDNKINTEANDRIYHDAQLKDDINDLTAQLDKKLTDYQVEVPLYVNQTTRTISVDVYDKTTIDNDKIEINNKIDHLLENNIFVTGNLGISKDLVNHTITLNSNTYSQTEINNLIAEEAKKREQGDSVYAGAIEKEIQDRVKADETKQDKLTAGDNITIDSNNVISSKDTTYAAGDNITIDENNVISSTAISTALSFVDTLPTTLEENTFYIVPTN